MEERSIIKLSFSLDMENSSLIRIDPISEHDPNVVSSEAAISNTSCAYSGRHDHGNLPTLKSTGPYAILISGILEGKMRCDEFLTAAIKDAELTSVQEHTCPTKEIENDVIVTNVEFQDTSNVPKKAKIEE